MTYEDYAKKRASEWLARFLPQDGEPELEFMYVPISQLSHEDLLGFVYFLTKR